MSAERLPILVVDDEPDVLATLCPRLSALGPYAPFPCPRAELAVGAAKVLHPAAILLDLSMPGLDGWQVRRALLEDPETREIPVLIMTAWVTDDLRARAQVAGVVQVLLKPFVESDLSGALRRAIRGRTSSCPRR